MVLPLPADVIARVQKDFPKNDVMSILQLLDEFRGENPELSNRVIRCIVFLARGSYEKFARAVELARLDWRDLIVEAEYDGWYGEENRRRNMNLPFSD